MENLPLEMLLEISQYLTPQELGRCSAVSRRWRNMFNQNIIWKRHCDPELMENLQNMPAAMFVAPVQDKDSTLEPICQFKLAFMRENQLRRQLQEKEWGCQMF